MEFPLDNIRNKIQMLTNCHGGQKSTFGIWIQNATFGNPSLFPNKLKYFSLLIRKIFGEHSYILSVGNICMYYVYRHFVTSILCYPILLSVKVVLVVKWDDGAYIYYTQYMQILLCFS